MKRKRSVWVVEERHWSKRKDWGPWTVCSSMHTSETLATQTMTEIKLKTIAKLGQNPFVLGHPFDFRVMRYDAARED